MAVPGERPATRWGRLLGGLFVVATVGFWGWLIFLAGDQDPPDRMDDPTFAESAEPTCATAQAAVEEVPGARQAADPQERAEQIETSTAILGRMVDELRADAPTAGRDGRMVAEWLDDWETYLGDRLRYAGQLAEGQDVQFQLTAKAGDQITEAVDGFADANDMGSCATPLDV